MGSCCGKSFQSKARLVKNPWSVTLWERRDVFIVYGKWLSFSILKVGLFSEKWNPNPHALSAFINEDALKTNKPYNESVKE
jgi:hypothetical protein